MVNSTDSDLIGYAGFQDSDPELIAMLDRLSTLRAQGPPVAVVVTDDAQCDLDCPNTPLPVPTQNTPFPPTIETTDPPR